MPADSAAHRLALAVFMELAGEHSPADWDRLLEERCQGNDAARVQARQLLRAFAAEGKEDASATNDVSATVNYADDPVESTGMSVGPYKLLQQIGQGGMGTVFLAEQSQPVQRMVALKVIVPGVDSRQMIARFEAERQALAMMDHPNIAKVLDAGTTKSGRPYFVMELVKGVPITKYCDERRLPLRDRLQLLIPVCHAVQHAHQKGVIHRDIKPSNVLVAEFDDLAVPKVIDFGIAKALSQKLTDKTMFTAFGEIVGTPEYMSPEQAKLNQLDIDTRSDIYSLGVLLYELLTGTTPFDRQKLRTVAIDELLRMIREDDPPKPSTRISALGNTASGISGERRSDPLHLSQLLRGELDWIVMKALEKDRKRRYDTASSLAADVEAYLADEPVQACPPSFSYTTTKFVRRHKAALSVVAGFFLVLVASSVVAWSLFVDARTARDDAVTARNDAQRALGESERLRQERESQLRRSTAMRLSAQSQAIRNDLPEQSVLLALEAIETTRQNGGAILPIAHQALRDSLVEIGGRPIRGLQEPGILEISPDCRWLATGYSGQPVRLWDLAAKEPATSPIILSGSGNSVECIAFSPDGRRLATGSADNTAQLWDLAPQAASAPAVVLRGHEKSIYAVAFSSDGRRLLTVGLDKTARLWDLDSPDQVGSSITLLGQEEGLFQAAFSPDLRWVATTGANNTARLWDLNAPDGSAPCFVLSGHQQEISCLAFANTGRWLVTGSYDDTARLWDLEATDPANSSIVMRVHGGGGVHVVAISPDGRKLVTCGMETHVWDLSAPDPANSSVVLRGHADLVLAAAFAGDSRWLVTGSLDKTARLWDLSAEDASASSIILRGHEKHLYTVAINSDGRLLVTVSSDGSARLWNLHHKDFAATPTVLRGHEGWIVPVAITPDGRRLVTGGYDKTARIWDLSLQDPVSSAIVLSGHEDSLVDLAISPDRRWLATGSWDKTARLWDLTAHDVAGSSIILRGHEGGISSVAFASGGRQLVTGSDDKTARVWDLSASDPSGSAIILSGHDDVVSSLAVTPDGLRLITVSYDKTARIWDLTAKDPSASSILLRGHDEALVSMAISPDGRWLFTGASDKTSRLWNLKSNEVVNSSMLLSSQDYFGAVTFSPDSRWLAAVGGDKNVRVWDVAAKNPSPSARVLTGHTDNLYSVTFTPDSRRLVTGSADKTARIWDLESPNPSASSVALKGHEGWVMRLAVSPDGQKLFTTSLDKTVRIWDLRLESLIDRARRVVGRELTPDERRQFLLDGSSDHMLH